MTIATLGLLVIVGCGSSTPDAQTKLDSKASATSQGQSASSIDSNAGNNATVQASADTPDGKKPSDAPEPTVRDRETILVDVHQSMQAGQPERAAGMLRELLLRDPDDVEALFLSAGIDAAQGDLDQAIETLESIPRDHPEAGLPALGQAADWCMKAQRYDEAETKYRAVLDRVPSAAVAHRQLAYLLNRQGRRHEAADHIRSLCRIGDVREDELHGLMSLSDAIYDAEGTPIDPNSGSRGYWPIGPSGEARKRFTDRDYAGTVDLLAPLMEAETARGETVPPSVDAFYGRALIEAQREDEFLTWLASADGLTDQAEYWAALGAFLVADQQFEPAVRSLGEALLRDPSDARSMRRIYQALMALDQKEIAERWFDRYTAFRAATLASNRIGEQAQPTSDDFAELIGALLELDRPLEATLWELVEAFYSRRPPEIVTQISNRRSEIADSANPFPSRDVRLCEMDLASYAPASLDEMKPSPTAIADAIDRKSDQEPAVIATPVLVDVADRVGLDHQYEIAAETVDSGLSIYQSVGGGIAVLDYDLDGFADLFFAQGAADPPAFRAQISDTLYRTIDRRMADVTESTGTTEDRYTIGVTAGDWNQDGFADLATANLGSNTLWINNGDGTFTSTTIDNRDDPNVMSTSMAMADVTGDAIPDLVELNYADDESLPRKPQRDANGHLSVVGPYDFSPARDRVWIGDGSGGFRVQDLGSGEDHLGTGLGVVVADFDGQAGNEIFVGNDALADHLWKPVAGNDSWNDIAAVSGCALSNDGTRTATMGIAATDFDASGTLDLFLTNFENEAATLFLNTGTAFQDRAVRLNLARDSFRVLGFGSQAIDFDNDGQMDLVVANGHVENTGDPNRPYQQPFQMFNNTGSRFELFQPNPSQGYVSDLHVGRVVATLDFDHDGRTDLVVNHIQEPSALLVNQTESPNQSIQVQLIGTASERDAIGGRVTVRTDRGRSLTRFVTAGDGYLCRNEPVLSFGILDGESVEQIEIRWPSGTEQIVTSTGVGGRITIVENQTDAYRLW